MSGVSIGIDLGGTKIEAVSIVMTPDLHILDRTRIPTNAHHGYDALTNTVASFIRDFASKYPEVKSIGIGMPGSADAQGRVKNSNTTCLNGRYFHQELQQKLPALQIRYANDANCFALAEAVLGAATGHSVVFGIIMGTGVGGGLVIDGTFRNGPHSICGEWGHTTLWPDHSTRCYCGKHGCVEQFLSGPGVERHYASLSGETAPLRDILQREKQGDDNAVQCVAALLDNYGRAVSNIINILDPDAIVLGGGVSNVDALYARGYEKVRQYVFSNEYLTPILRNSLGDSAGVLGAALLCLD